MSVHGVPAGGRDETTPLCQNQLRATKTAQKRADSHHVSRRSLPGFGCIILVYFWDAVLGGSN